ncbi:putative gustatory receptor 28b isoform X1 [Halyomorpha halys]|uniref:putative gustatory receptor 28b isoform X1 n=1 Tax=Halyomorpha halys TaxID=286706 RepID=UPI0034D27BD2
MKHSYGDKPKNVEKVMDFANRILSASVNVNDLFSLQMLLIMSVCFWGSCTHMYRIIIGITYPSEKVNTYTLPHICNFLLCSYSVWRVNHATTSASNKSKEFNALLYKLMINDVTKDILQNDKLSLHILMKREVVFTACGFFNLDYTLVHSMIASATTYLVILIQFGQPGSISVNLEAATTNVTSITLPSVDL